MAKVLVVIAEEGFQDKEYEDTKHMLEKNGHQAITASTKEKAHGKLGRMQEIDIMLNQANEPDFDAIAFIGGPGCSQYYTDEIALNLAKSFYNAGKITSAICAAPTILANAGLLNGKTCTCHDSQADTITKKGANYTGQPVETDGILITANGPSSAMQFGETISKSL